LPARPNKRYCGAVMEASIGPAVGYGALLRTNKAYRRLWLGAIVSLAGDWFTTVALFSMLLEFTGRAESVGFALIARFLPAALFGPLAGVVADRLPRKKVMIACDLLRVFVVLGFILVKDRSDVGLVYLLTFVQLTLSAFFDPAEQAAIGAVTTPEEVVTANTIHAATWSAMLSLGAMAGGLVTAYFGRTTAFVIDAFSFAASAILISRAAIPAIVHRPADRKRWTTLLGIDDLLEGLALLQRERRLRGLLMAKAGWGLAGGGAFLLYAVFGERVFTTGGSAATGIGVLYGARGLGALLGPVLARRYGGDGEAWLQRAIGLSFFLAIGGYASFAFAPNVWVGMIALAVVHLGVSTIWVFSNALVNLWVPDAMRGRVFAADMTVFTLMLIGSSYVTGFALDVWGLDPRLMMAILALSQVLPAIAWRLSQRRTLAVAT
jgi:MFS family permease